MLAMSLLLTRTHTPQVDTLSVDETVTDTAFIFDTEMDVAGERTIPEGKSMEWKAQVCPTVD